MKIIFTSFDKAAITNLPRVLFPGKIVVVDKPEDTETAVNDLLSHYIAFFPHQKSMVQLKYNFSFVPPKLVHTSHFVTI